MPGEAKERGYEDREGGDCRGAPGRPQGPTAPMLGRAEGHTWALPPRQMLLLCITREKR